jgi:hypothetical protein
MRITAVILLLLACWVLAKIGLVPNPNDILTRLGSASWWVWLALALALVCLFFFVYGIAKTTSPGGGAQAAFGKWPDPYVPVGVMGKHFANERVLLDGFSYSNCVFTNVTFVYNGTTAVQFSHNEVHGFRVASDNAAVEGSLMFARGFGLLKEEIELDLPPGIVVNPPNQN